MAFHCRQKEGPCASQRAQSDLAVGHDEDLGRSSGRLGLPGQLDRLLHAGGRKLEFLDGCRTEDELAAVEHAVLARFVLD